jgi:outer membrane biogenesis lipoprotein LolB
MTTKRRETFLVLAAIAAAAMLAACSAKKPEQARESEREPTAEMTERQRDSTLAHSKLPGAGAVGRAMEQADSAAARAARENVQSQ